MPSPTTPPSRVHSFVRSLWKRYPMDITHKSESPVGRSKPSCGEVVDAVSCGSLNLREPNGASTGHPEINKGISGVVKRFKQRRSRTNNHASDSLSDIDDAEVSRYLNTKEEMLYKRMLWEAINGKYVNEKAAERKKGAPLKKAAKTMEKVKSTRRSSRINYEALKILNEELEHGSKASQSHIITADSCAFRSDHTPSLEMNGSNESNDSGFQPEMSYDEENETSAPHTGDFYGQYGDEHDTGDFYNRYGDENHSDDYFLFD
ncbi:uncharacterized protein LOC142547414 isoform X5 [Primulina tabacum]|uniref:uncharacterized protein LOC142547414 isoform X5 n=1 Tax=Primulina tabacum TaxID=48773 RepID=UPI003F5A2321